MRRALTSALVLTIVLFSGGAGDVFAGQRDDGMQPRDRLSGIAMGDTTTQAASAPPSTSAAPTIETYVIGRSVQGRPLILTCAGDGERLVLLVGGIHTGHEAHTVTLVTQLGQLVRSGATPVPASVRLCLLPAANPDGLVLGTRVNANGVDLNRNWPAGWLPIAYHPGSGTVSAGSQPLSEPETRALYDFVAAAKPVLVISWHCCADLVEANTLPGATFLGRRYAEAAGMGFTTEWGHYAITGEFIRAMQRLGIAAFDVELATGETSFTRHFTAVEALLAQVAAANPPAQASQPSAEAPIAHAVYVVRPGDTLAGIARTLGTTVEWLLGANRIANPNLIVPGQRLHVPA